ncbi:PQQ-binding-like beta-propeller repeat protein [Promicromonospora sp. NPDC060271]|uniref:outer membrane protein assembly factor BamB family protein n=1 Tax=Promicromonospora sp. NPDC060271 TaxID=3347089 RepID=UPI00365FE3AB
MPRDPDEGSAVVFDLVGHGEPGPGGPRDALGVDGAAQVVASDVSDGADREPDAPGAGAWWRAVPTVAAVLAVVVGTGIASDGVRDAARIERMRDFGGVVEDVSAPLTEKWVWDGTVGVGTDWDGTEAMVLGDVLAFQSGRDLIALDPATGEEAWVVPLGDDPVCGPAGVSPYEGTSARPVSTTVCLSGAAADREVVTVRPDGTVSAPRALDASDARRHGPARPGPDGTVLRATRVGPESEVDRGDARCEDTGECGGTVTAGRDVELRAESAVTGAELWTVTVPFEEADARECMEASWADQSGQLAFDGEVHPDAFGARVTADLVRLFGCGVEATVTPDGVLLGPGRETGYVESLALGGYAWLDHSGPGRTVVQADDGAVVVDLAGHVRGPRVADGVGPDTLLGTDETGQRLLAYEADGVPRWDVEARAPHQMFLAQVGRTAVVAAQGADVKGLDIETGGERWRRDVSADGDEVLETFTDGRAVLLHLYQVELGLRRMVSLDAATGEVLWRETDEAATSRTEAARTGLDDEQPPVLMLVAVDGHLLEVSRDAVRGLG